MRLAHWLLAACIGLSCVSPPRVGETEPRPVVVGTGNRLSGRVDVTWLGDPAHPFAAAVDGVARLAAFRGLEVKCTRRRSLGSEPPTSAVVATTWPPTAPDAERLREYRQAGRGVVVFVDAELDAAARPLGVTKAPVAGSIALHAIDPTMPAAWGDVPSALAWPDDSGSIHVVAAGPGTDLGAVAISALRHAIVRADGVRYLTTVFAEISAEVADGTLVVKAPTLLAGAATMDVIAPDGAPLLPPGPLRPIDLSKLPDAERALLRLRFAGEGIEDEVRLWVPDLLPLTFAKARLTGFAHAWAGDPALFRVVVDGPDGSGVEGCAIDAVLGDASVVATTDALGAAVVAFPASATNAEGKTSLTATIRGRVSPRTLEAEIDVNPREDECVVQTDRPVYRPGGVVKLRAFLLGPGGRPKSDAALTVDVRDPRGRLVRTFAGATDAFGTVTFELRLAARIADGVYEARVRVGPSDARASFLVEDAARLPFDVRVELANPRPVAGERVRGAVTIRDWDGADVRGATVRAGLGDAELKESRGDGRIEFDLATEPAKTSRSTTLRVEVESGGSVVTSESPLVLAAKVPAGPDAITIEVASTAAPGSGLDVGVRAKREDGVVDVDLVGRGRVLASATARIDGGRAIVRLAIPEDARGPAEVVVRMRDGTVARSPVFVGRPSLAVTLSAPSAATPGDDIEARVCVLDEHGHAVPALLDVRGVDRAYRALTESSTLDPRRARDAEPLGEPIVLASDDGRGAWFRFERLAASEADAALRRAALAADEGREFDVALPWGARVFAGDIGGARCVTAEDAVTRRVGPGAGDLPQRFAMRAAATDRATDVAELLPQHAIRFAHDPIPRNSRWLVRHQSPDGSWHPSRFLDLCRVPGCDGPGLSEFQVGSTSLALLCFLGVGETHQSGTCRETVKNGLRWLRDVQKPDGFVGDRAAPCAALNHALAALALTEAYGMTGSRVFKDPAQRALEALVAMQRPDGSFAEAGATNGSVILGTFCSMAIKSSVMSELTVERARLHRYVAWLDAHTDEETGAPALSVEEMSAYPFGGASARRTAAAGSILSRAFAGATSQTTPLLARAAATVLEDLPTDVREDDPLSIYFGTLALFQIGGESWRRWNGAMKTAVIDRQEIRESSCARGSWPSAPGRIGRLLTTELGSLSMQVYYRYGRVLGVRGDPGGHADAKDVRVRSEFPDLLVSEFALRTDERGERALRLHVPDQVTTWDVGVGAWDREGRYGRATTEIRSTLPLFATLGLPPRLHRGDVVRVPVAVRSTMDVESDCTIEVRTAEGVEIVEAPPTKLRVPAGATVPAFATMRVTGPERVVLEVVVTGAGRADAVRATADVAPTSRRFAASVPVAIGAATRAAVQGSRDARAVLRVRGTVLGAATSSLSALLRRPHGCFEQVSATLYPAMLAWRCLGAAPDDPRVELLRDGYQQLLAFEERGGGFGLYPGEAPRADLTALGIHELVDLDPVVGVDREVLHRAAEYLAANLPDDAAQRLYALGALRRTSARVEAELPELGDDPYLLALALTQDLLTGDAAKGAVERLRSAVLRNAAGAASWRSAARGLFRGGPPRDVETTALAVEALARRGDDVALARDGLETLRAAICADGAWGDTRETVAALRALIAVSARVAKGRLIVVVKGREPLAADLGADVVEFDLGRWSDDDEVTLRFEGEGVPWATLCVRGSTDAAPATVSAAALALAVKWPDAALRAGEKSAVRVTISCAAAGVTAPLVVVPLPGGVQADRAALERAATAGGYSFVEMEDGAVRLYGADMPPGTARTVSIPFTARSAGSFSTGSASASPYYDPDAMSWTPSRRIEIRAE